MANPTRTNQALANFLAAMSQPAREETYPLLFWHQMTAAEQAVVEERLILRAQDLADDRAVATLAAVHSQKALPLLQELAQQQSGLGATARRGLLAWHGDPAAADAVAADLRAGTDFQRFAAARELGAHGDAAAVSALLTALEDPDPLVRMETYDQVLRLTGLPTLTQLPPQAPLQRLNLLLSTELRALHQPAASAIRDLVTAVQGGATLADLDLAYVPGGQPDLRSALVDALGEPDDPLPVAVILHAAGHDRAWAEALLAAQLQPEIADIRAPAALAALAAMWTVPALREAAEATAHGTFSRESAQAAAALSH